MPRQALRSKDVESDPGNASLVVQIRPEERFLYVRAPARGRPIWMRSASDVTGPGPRRTTSSSPGCAVTRGVTGPTGAGGRRHWPASGRAPWPRLKDVKRLVILSRELTGLPIEALVAAQPLGARPVIRLRPFGLDVRRLTARAWAAGSRPGCCLGDPAFRGPPQPAGYARGRWPRRGSSPGTRRPSMGYNAANRSSGAGPVGHGARAIEGSSTSPPTARRNPDVAMDSAIFLAAEAGYLGPRRSPAHSNRRFPAADCRADRADLEPRRRSCRPLGLRERPLPLGPEGQRREAWACAPGHISSRALEPGPPGLWSVEKTGPRRC